jgi:exodeoxyribonuclease VII large subunit
MIEESNEPIKIKESNEPIKIKESNEPITVKELNEPITVKELNETIKNILIKNITSQLNVIGEISGLKISGNHTYLTLKDCDSSINITSWNRKYEKLKNGDNIIVTGKLACFIKGGSYALNVFNMEKIGIGKIFETIELNKKLFEEKGYFSKSFLNLNIPTNIKKIGILTSASGAALQDILYVLKKNNFYGHVYVKNCLVQGSGCPQSVSECITWFNKNNKTYDIDVLIITRGGGSTEDLFSYSSKEIVKAINKCDIYTISAIGHEVDTMLSDYAANYRSPTPSVAGELVSIKQKELFDKFIYNKEKMNTIKNKINIKLNKLVTVLEKINCDNIIINKINNNLTKLTNIKQKLHSKIKSILQHKIDMLNEYTLKNNSLNPINVLSNGYVVIIDEKNNLINTLEQFNKPNQKLKIIFTDGECDIEI